MALPLNDNQEQTREAVIRTELRQLTAETEQLNEYRDYYDGTQPLRYGTDKLAEEFGSDFPGFKANVCDIVVDAVADKLEIIGVQIGRQPEERTQYTDLSKAIWEQFLDNDIDDKQTHLHEDVLIAGRTTAIVWPDPKKGFTFHWNPAQIVRVRYDEDDPDKIVWAVKRWRTPTGDVYVTYYTAEAVFKYIDTRGETPATRSDRVLSPVDQIPQQSSESLTPRRVPGEPWPLRNPFGEVPVIEFLNRTGQSELADVVPMQDLLNIVWLNMTRAGEFMANPQRVMVTKQKAPSGGWHNDPARVWHLEPMVAPDGAFIMPNFGEFEAYDPSVYIKVIDAILEQIANSTKTPMRYFRESDRGGRGDAPSGESLKVEDKPLLDKVRKLSVQLGNRWYQAVRLAAQALYLNPTYRTELPFPEGFDGTIPYGEIVWRDQRLEYRSAALAEGIQMQKLGLPNRYIWEQIGIPPEDLPRIEEMNQQQQEEQMDRMEEQMRVSAQNSDSPPERSTDGQIRAPQNRSGPRPSNT